MSSTGRHLHLRPRIPVLVAVGGVLGTAARFAVAEAIPHRPGQWPWSTFSVNVVGAFVLGLLLGSLAARGPDVGVRRSIRLGVGTGFLGAFTTYSAFAVDLVRLTDASHPGLAVAHAFASVAAGLIAAAAGIALAPSAASLDDPRPPVDPDQDAP